MTSWGSPGVLPAAMTSHTSRGESDPDRRQLGDWGRSRTAAAERWVRPWSDEPATTFRTAASASISRWASCSSCAGSGTRPWPGARWGVGASRSPSASGEWCTSSIRTPAPARCFDSACTAFASYDPTRTTDLHNDTIAPYDVIQHTLI